MNNIQTIPVAVVGVGNFGRQHARVYSCLPEAELAVVIDADLARAQAVATKFGCEARTDIEGLEDVVQAVSIAVPTSQHAEVGHTLIQAGIDVLIEKPIAADTGSAQQLITIAEKHNRVLQVGHLERFNPIVEAASKLATIPLFFEVHRMSLFSPRSLDTDVILDLMVHDLDILLTLVHSDIERVDANGLSVISSQSDIANARIKFRNGCVANLTASRVSTEKVRKLRFFQPNQYISLDYQRQQGVAIRLDKDKRPQIQPLQAAQGEPLQRQLQSFLHCVKQRNTPRVDGLQGLRSLELALKISKAIDEHALLVEKTLAAFDN